MAHTVPTHYSFIFYNSAAEQPGRGSRSETHPLHNGFALLIVSQQNNCKSRCTLSNTVQHGCDLDMVRIGPWQRAMWWSRRRRQKGKPITWLRVEWWSEMQLNSANTFQNQVPMFSYLRLARPPSRKTRLPSQNGMHQQYSTYQLPTASFHQVHSSWCVKQHVSKTAAMDKSGIFHPSCDGWVSTGVQVQRPSLTDTPTDTPQELEQEVTMADMPTPTPLEQEVTMPTPTPLEQEADMPTPTPVEQEADMTTPTPLEQEDMPTPTLLEQEADMTTPTPLLQ